MHFESLSICISEVRWWFRLETFEPLRFFYIAFLAHFGIFFFYYWINTNWNRTYSIFMRASDSISSKFVINHFQYYQCFTFVMIVLRSMLQKQILNKWMQNANENSWDFIKINKFIQITKIYILLRIFFSSIKYLPLHCSWKDLFERHANANQDKSYITMCYEMQIASLINSLKWNDYPSQLIEYLHTIEKLHLKYSTMSIFEVLWIRLIRLSLPHR